MKSGLTQWVVEWVAYSPSLDVDVEGLDDRVPFHRAAVAQVEGLDAQGHEIVDALVVLGLVGVGLVDVDVAVHHGPIAPGVDPTHGSGVAAAVEQRLGEGVDATYQGEHSVQGLKTYEYDVNIPTTPTTRTRLSGS